MKIFKSTLPQYIELEIPEMESMMLHGCVFITWIGNENIYFLDDFGNEYFCKCYP